MKWRARFPSIGIPRNWFVVKRPLPRLPPIPLCTADDLIRYGAVASQTDPTAARLFVKLIRIAAAESADIDQTSTGHSAAAGDFDVDSAAA